VPHRRDVLCNHDEWLRVDVTDADQVRKLSAVSFQLSAQVLADS